MAERIEKQAHEEQAKLAAEREMHQAKLAAEREMHGIEIAAARLVKGKEEERAALWKTKEKIQRVNESLVRPEPNHPKCKNRTSARSGA